MRKTPCIQLSLVATVHTSCVKLWAHALGQVLSGFSLYVVDALSGWQGPSLLLASLLRLVIIELEQES